MPKPTPDQIKDHLDKQKKKVFDATDAKEAFMAFANGVIDDGVQSLTAVENGDQTIGECKNELIGLRLRLNEAWGDIIANTDHDKGRRP